MEKKKKASPALSFEKALEGLEEIARRLEDGELDLDESIAEFEKGVRLARICHEKLDAAEKKIEILQKAEGGRIERRAVDTDEETGELDDDEDIQGTLL
ncbi:MAG TPA: exodeoxyribonuclease VII small subunit [Spirochaetota bacterium]|nr:exodeoxyribonuclease VII small subunit [Spirochaetota bacterium]HNT09530.1 exodeoxyribonuclease VII small subunit [Spirochaetota bacterium]HNV46363.1 exodeoxyribonuclease VII small subunit [Spirochaetota bacterium]HPI22020.1 exodeoxyribonuclease VII small subunit [Spirochaetota bacterium]HPU89496.1 exodeoxyribonuclease VII small subunit [Spirochaetota bacterium]